MAKNKRQLAKLWSEQIEIDYYSAFIKSWIALNAWMNHKCGEKSDNQKIEDIIETSALKDKICKKIKNKDDQLFLQRISKLHEILEDKELQNQGKKVSLSKITIKKSPTDTLITNKGIEYSFKFESNKNKCIIKNTSGSEIFNFIDDATNYNVEKLDEKIRAFSLTTNQAGFAKAYYGLLSPTEEIDLLKIDGTEYYQIGDYKLLKNEEYIFHSLLKTIYDVRCLLFHGDIDPEDHLDLYEQAYFITKVFVNSVHS